MKPPPFELCVPRSVEEAIGLLARYGADAQVLAGGQSLLPLLNYRLASPAYVVSIGKIDTLQRLDCSTGTLTIGAGVKQRAVELDDRVQDAAPVIGQVLKHVSWPVIRNAGTWCGSVAYADPTAQIPAVASVLGGDVMLISERGARRVACDEFFVGPYQTVADADELVVGCALTVPSYPRTGWGFREVAWAHGGRVIAGAIAMVSAQDDRVKRLRVRCFGGYRGLSRPPDEDRYVDAPVHDSSWIDELATDVADQDTGSPMLVDVGADLSYGRDMAIVAIGDATREAVQAVQTAA